MEDKENITKDLRFCFYLKMNLIDDEHAFQQLRQISYELFNGLSIRNGRRKKGFLFTFALNYNGIFIQHIKSWKMSFRRKASFSLIHLTLSGRGEKWMKKKANKKNIAIRTFFCLIS
jgi:hypothetical protein